MHEHRPFAANRDHEQLRHIPPYGSILADFTANTTKGNNVNFTMSTLKPYYNYLIKKDGINLSIQQADTTGKIAFNNYVWNSASRFTVMEDAPRDPDGNFTIGDLEIIRQHFGEKTSAPYPKYDPNKEGIVDIVDVVHVFRFKKITYRNTNNVNIGSINAET